MGSPGQTQTPSALLNNGTKIPLLGLGTGNFTTEEEIENVILTAIEAGYRHFDTASMYRSECALGKALKKAFERGLVNREDVFVTTKLWCTDVHPDDVLPALRKSLKELQLDYVDLYLIHWPVRVKKGAVFPSLKPDDILPVDLNSTWQAMEKLVGLGLAKAIGVSNFSSKKIHDLLSYATINPAVNQVEMHPFWQQRKLREYCRNVNIHVSAWSPLARGTGTAGSGGVINHPVIQEIARKHAKTPAQILEDMELLQLEPTILYCDNQSTLKIMKNHVHHAHTKHIEVHHYFIRELIQKVVIERVYRPTKEHLANIFTKPLGHERFQFF